MEPAGGQEMVGDSQEGQLEVLAAAMTSPLQGQQQGGQHGTHAAPQATTAASPPLAARGPAAAAYVAECRRQGAQAHPLVLHSLNGLEPEAYAPLTPHQRPGKGGMWRLWPPAPCCIGPCPTFERAHVAAVATHL